MVITSEERLSLAEVRELRERLETQRRVWLDEYEHDLARERAIPLDDTGDVADRAEVSTDREDLFAAAESAFEGLQQVDEALRRIGDGTFGICLEGGEPISIERLRAVPWARYCAAHQEELERRQRHGPGRPPRFTPPPGLAQAEES